MIEEKLARLAAAGFDIVPVAEVARHFVFARDGFVALVERRENGFGNIGAAGLVTDHGFAALQWRGENPFFVAHSFEQPATPDQVDLIRRFDRDLRGALAIALEPT